MPRVLVVGWSAADWKVIHPLVDAGEMPALAGLIERGTIGDLATLQPPIPPMLSTSTATGKRANRHGVLGPTEVDPATNCVRAVGSASRCTKAIWNILVEQGLRSHVVGWLASHPAEPTGGIFASDLFPHPTAAPGDPWPILPGTVHPPERAEILGELRMSPEEVDGELLRLFVPRASEVDQEADRRLAQLARMIAETVSINAAASWALKHEPWDFAAVSFQSLGRFSHAFMRYHPPRQTHVAEAAFTLYEGVVRSAYRMLDLMLGGLVRLAGPEAHVIVLSEHGFHSDHLRPVSEREKSEVGATVWHRSHGVLCMAGPGIKRDERIHGASLLDVVPTILQLFGRPIGEDLEGRVLSEAFDLPPTVERIPSWEMVAGVESPGGRTQAPLPCDEAASDILLGRDVAPGGLGAGFPAPVVLLEREWNLARVLLEQQDWMGAWRALECAHAGLPHRNDVALVMAQCQLHLGLLDDAEETIAGLSARVGDAPSVALVQSLLALRRGRDAEAMALLGRAAGNAGAPSAIYVQLGFACIDQQLLDEAGRAFGKAMAIDPHDAMAHLGQARLGLRRRHYPEVADAALRAIGLCYQLPRAHYLLGVSLVALGSPDAGLRAFETALSFPGAPSRAHGWLARLYHRAGDAEQAQHHRRQWLQGEQRDRQDRDTFAAIAVEARSRRTADRESSPRSR